MFLTCFNFIGKIEPQCSYKVCCHKKRSVQYTASELILRVAEPGLGTDLLRRKGIHL